MKILAPGVRVQAPARGIILRRIGGGTPALRVRNAGSAQVELRQVVTERRQEQAVDAVRSAGEHRRCRVKCSCPCVTSYVGILRAKLQASERSLVHLDPESDRAFDQVLGVGAAIRECAESETSSSARLNLGVTASRRLGRSTITNRSVPVQGIRSPTPFHILLAAVQVDIEAWVMELERCQTLIAAQRCERAIRVHSCIGKTASTVAANASALEGVECEVKMLGDGDTAIGSDAASIDRGVVGERSWVCYPGTSWIGCFHAGIDAVAEAAADAIDFPVTEAGFNDGLDDEVGGRVERVVRLI